MSQRRPLIVHYTNSQLLFFIAGIVLLLAIVLSVGFFYGNKTYSDDQQCIQDLEASLDQQAEKSAASQQALLAVELTAKVDAAALEQTRQQMLDMQKQIYQRDQELKLYLSLIHI